MLFSFGGSNGLLDSQVLATHDLGDNSKIKIIRNSFKQKAYIVVTNPK